VQWGKTTGIPSHDIGSMVKQQPGSSLVPMVGGKVQRSPFAVIPSLDMSSAVEQQPGRSLMPRGGGTVQRSQTPGILSLYIGSIVEQHHCDSLMSMQCRNDQGRSVHFIAPRFNINTCYQQYFHHPHRPDFRRNS
jgi:hypothetical protein